MDESRVEPLVEALSRNLSSHSHTLRWLSLQILNMLYSIGHTTSSELLSTAIAIEETPLTLMTARHASMCVRKLASEYSASSLHPWLQVAIPRFCFGILTIKFSQLWEDSCLVLKEISGAKTGEEIVTQQAFEWLNYPTDIEISNE